MKPDPADDTVVLPGQPPAHCRGLIGAGVTTIVVALGGLAAWATLVELDRAVAGPGTVVVSDQRKVVQHLAGGRVQSIAVTEGAHVSRGQPLLSLDRARLEGELRAVQQQRLLAWAAVERLQSQAAGQRTVPWSDALRDYARRLGASAQLGEQQRLLASHDDQAGAERQQQQARRGQLAVERQGHEQAAARLAEQLDLLERQFDTLSRLAADGHYPRIRLLDMERQIIELRTSGSNSRVAAAAAGQALAEAQAGAMRRTVELRRDAQQALVDAQQRLADLTGREATLLDSLEHTDVLAPVSGTVVGLDVHSVDGVIQPGQTLMEIVPDDEPLIVEARFALAATERVGPGQPVNLRFVSMERNATPVVRGVVMTVAADRLEHKRSGESYLLVRVSMPPGELRRLRQAGVAVRAGLPVEVLVNVERRTLASYLVKPLSDGFAKALIE